MYKSNVFVFCSGMCFLSSVAGVRFIYVCELVKENEDVEELNLRYNQIGYGILLDQSFGFPFFPGGTPPGCKNAIFALRRGKINRIFQAEAK